MAPGTSLGYSISELEIYGVLPASRFDTNAIAEETAEDEIQIECYPNPARDIVHVNGLKDGTLVRVISSTGSMQYDKTVMNASIDIIDIPAGLYILDCMNGVRKKIIKE